MIFLQMTPSGEVTNPSAWASLANALGPAWFFTIVCFAAFFALIFLLGWMGYKLGSKLMDRLDLFLGEVQKSTATNAKTLESQATICNATYAGVSSLRSAGHNFSNAIQRIGKEIGVNVEEDCEKIHEKLRTQLPMEQ